MLQFAFMEDFEKSLNFPEHVRLFQYWRGLMSDGKTPLESVFNTNAVADIIPWMTLIRVEPGEGGYRYRGEIVGTGVTERFGRDITGKYADELYSESYLAQLSLSYGDAVETATPNIWRCMLETREGETLYYDRLILPLADDKKHVTALISTFAFHTGWGTNFTPAPPGQSTWLKLA